MQWPACRARTPMQARCCLECGGRLGEADQVAAELPAIGQHVAKERRGLTAITALIMMRP
jgi:hypothetical protein